MGHPGGWREATVPGVVAAVLAAVGVVPPLRAPLGEFVAAYPWLLPLASCVLALAFGRGRTVAGVAVLVVTAYAASVRGGAAGFALGACSVLAPLNLMVLCWLRERPALSAAGAARIAAPAVQAGVVALLWLAYLPSLVGAVTSPASGLLAGAGLPGLGIVAGAVGLAGAAARAATVRGPVESSLLFALVLLTPALAGASTPAFWNGSACAVLFVGALQAGAGAAYRDALTGLPSRRALDEVLDRTTGVWSVAMVDVDHFKALNDTHGHDVGDQVLRMIAARLARTGGGGRTFRYGGEEFAVVFRGKAVKQVLPFLEGVRQAIAGTPFVVRAADRPPRKPKEPRTRRARPGLLVTVSIGVADGRGRTAAEALHTADAALYRAKAAGRDRVVA